MFSCRAAFVAGWSQARQLHSTNQRPGRSVPPRLDMKTRRPAMFTILAEEVSRKPGIFFGEVFVIVLLSTAFESGEKWLRNIFRLSGNAIGSKILDALFREITILGFIGLLLFLLTHAFPMYNSEVVFGLGEEEPLSETFEYVHMATFLLLVVLLFQGLAVLYLSSQTVETWSEYESVRAFGMAPDSMESLLVQEGYLERKTNPDAPRGADLILTKPFVYGDSVLDRWLLRNKPVTKLVMWRAIRHGFLFDGPQSKLLAAEGNINPGLFSFRAFMEYQLGEIVLSLVEVDVQTWFTAISVLAAVTGICLASPSVSPELAQCLSSWAILLTAVIFTVVLEEDTYDLTPQVPSDGRRLLQLFQGTSQQMLRRSSWMENVSGESDLERLGSCRPSVDKDASENYRSVKGRRYRPGLPGCEGLSTPRIGDSAGSAEVQVDGKGPSKYLLVKQYVNLFRLLTFLQATLVTSLIVTYLSTGVQSWSQLSLYALSWAEWPIMLFWIVPSLVRRLTVRAAVTRTQQNNWYRDQQCKLVRKVVVAGLEGLLRDCTRLLHLQGLEARAVLSGAAWAQPASVRRALSGKGSAGVSESQRKAATEAVQRGTKRFELLPTALRLEVISIFASWDVRNDGEVASSQLAQILKSLGFSATANRAAENLIRLVDDDGTGVLTLRKCKALFMLAVAERPMSERRRDLETFFSRLQKQSPREATVFEVAEALPVSTITAEDLSTLIFRHFGAAKPVLTRAEFVEWVEATEFSTTAFE